MESPNKQIKNLSKEFLLGGMVARYVWSRNSNAIGLVLLPTSLRNADVSRREHVRGVEVDAYADALGQLLPAWSVDSLVQVKTAVSA